MSPADSFAHPTPVQAFKLATNHATLLRHIYNHPEFKYLSPPNAAIYKIDHDNTPSALIWVSEFIGNSYVEFVIPFLPAGATRKCKEIANPWAYADPAYEWEWTWDEAAGEMRDRQGTLIPFPSLGEATGKDKISDMHLRTFMVQKLILENETDAKARLMIGGKSFDFGKDAKEAVASLDSF